MAINQHLDTIKHIFHNFFCVARPKGIENMYTASRSTVFTSPSDHHHDRFLLLREKINDRAEGNR